MQMFSVEAESGVPKLIPVFPWQYPNISHRPQDKNKTEAMTKRSGFT